MSRTNPTIRSRSRTRGAVVAAGCTTAAGLLAFGVINDHAATASPPTTEPSSWEAHVVLDLCPGDAGHPALTFAMGAAAYDADGNVTGSGRLTQLFVVCDIRFEGEVDPELGRPRTNIEAIIADPANEITPNETQIDVLNRELAIYWRVTRDWIEATGGG